MGFCCSKEINREIFMIEVINKSDRNASKSFSINADTTGKNLKSFLCEYIFLKFREKESQIAITSEGRIINDEVQMCQLNSFKMKGMVIECQLAASLTLPSVFRFFQLHHFIFDPDTNMDYSTNSPSISVRGGFPYYQPSSGKRYGLKMQQRYDNGNDDWIKMDGRKGEWAVAFHGILNPNGISNNTTVLQSILSGLDQGYTLVEGKRQAHHQSYSLNKPRQLVGNGVYMSPHIEECLRDYCTPVEIDKIKYKIVLQCRINPHKIKICTNHIYWVMNDRTDIRTYGIVVFEEKQYSKYPDRKETFSWNKYQTSVNTFLNL